MLSRVAESLYWTSRYIERAEDITRLLDVNFHALLEGPSEFFRRIREGSHAFLGVTSAPMPRGDGFQFVQIGTHLERADKTVRIVDVKYAAVESLADTSPAAQVRLIAMLKSCSA